MPSELIFTYHLFPIWDPILITPYRKSLGFLKYQSWRGIENSFDILLTIIFCIFLQDLFLICDSISPNQFDAFNLVGSPESTVDILSIERKSLDRPNVPHKLTLPVSDDQELAPSNSNWGRILVTVTLALIFHSIIRDGFG